MSAGAVRPSSRRRDLAVLVGFLLIALGLLGMAWGRGWFAPARKIPGDVTEGDADVVEAVQEARAAVAKEPKSANAWGRLGQVLQVHSYFGPALDAYAEAALLDPRNPNWPYLRASVLLVLSAPADAIPDLERAAERGLGESALSRLGELLIGQGRFEEAGDALRKVLEARPNDPRAHLAMAQVAVSRQAWAECLRHLDAVEDAPPARKQACALRLLAYGRLGDAVGAKRERERLAKLPDDPLWPDPVLEELPPLQVGLTARLSNALNLLKHGQQQQAVATLHDAIRDYPDSALAYGALGRCMAILRDYPASEEALSKSLELAPESADIWTVLADVRIQRKDQKGALECLLEVVRLRPTDAEAHCKIGLLRVEAGDRAGAIESFRQALRFRPDYREARAELDMLAGGAPGVGAAGPEDSR